MVAGCCGVEVIKWQAAPAATTTIMVAAAADDQIGSYKVRYLSPMDVCSTTDFSKLHVARQLTVDSRQIFQESDEEFASQWNSKVNELYESSLGYI